MPEFGLLVPSFTSLEQDAGAVLGDCAEQVEEVGLDSLWVIDHLLPAPVYAHTWLDPLLVLATLAGRTRRVKLGTAVLLASLHHPVRLAAQVASLQALSRGRLILGLGTGWNPVEFDALQIPRGERGSRTDEAIEVLRLLLSGKQATHRGRHFAFSEVRLQPPAPTPIWVGGGSQPPVEGASEPGRPASGRVIERIAGADGWIASPQAGPAELGSDWERVRTAARSRGRPDGEITFAQQMYFHLVDTDDRERALEEQRSAFAGYLGPSRPWSLARDRYLVGSLSDIVARLRERIAAGVQYFILGPVTDRPDALRRQVELLRHRILPQL